MSTEARPLDLDRYQQALLTQGLIFPADTSYLVPSIVGHVGALFTLNSYPRITPVMRITVYRDIAARTAILLHGLGVTRLQTAYPANGPRDDHDHLLRLLTAATGVYRNHAQVYMANQTADEWLIDSAETLWRTLRGCSDAVAGVPFQTVLQASLSETAAL